MDTKIRTNPTHNKLTSNVENTYYVFYSTVTDLAKLRG